MPSFQTLRSPAPTFPLARLSCLTAVIALAVPTALPAAPRNTGDPIEVPGERYVGGPSVGRRVAASNLRRSDTTAPIGMQVELEPLANNEVLEKRASSKAIFGVPLKVGVHRQLPAGFPATMDATSLDWEPATNDGQVATFVVRSPGARALRVAIFFERLPAGSEVRFYSIESPQRALGPYEAEFLAATSSGRSRNNSHRDPFWSPVVDGDALAVEIFVPGRVSDGDVLITLLRVSHLLTHPLEERDLGDIGNSGPCEKDVACLKNLQDAADSVAKIVFEVGDDTFLCTGQLINDTDPETFKPFFTTAAHCIHKKRVARTATFFWLFQRFECNGDDPTSVTQTAGGAKLKVTTGPPGEGRLTSDFTLLKLKRRPPEGVTFGGWRVRDPAQDVDKKVKAAHHPFGDVKMGSRGRSLDLLQIPPDGDILFEEPFTHYMVQWKKGVTEGGSSGSTIWAGRKWPNQFALGPLTGGFASCDARREPDFYGIFSEAYNHKAKIRRLLDPDTE